MQKAYQLASENACKSATKGERLYDTKVRSSCRQKGDGVLVRNLLERGGQGKLRSYWEENIYVTFKTTIDGIHVQNETDNVLNAASDGESEIIIPNNTENVTSKDKPTGLRHPGTRFTYDTLGKPSIQTLDVTSNQIRQYPTTVTPNHLKSNLNPNSVPWYSQYQQPYHHPYVRFIQPQYMFDRY
ncbi:unnamed protein product [Mytilus coruscus]|uniref:Uncharacterized protein n=1 Tax=Mytilus coruscus TaxID=42192 RepID=A0A6J8AYU4_MYTCO|nr:unnamed protein product [Mytilus coruscus]